MKNERVCANSETRPVSDWENKSANFNALCCEAVFQSNVDHAKNLRDRQAVYLASLPTDPPEAIRAAIETLHPNGEEYPEGVEEALHLSFALAAIVKGGDLDHEGHERDAALYLSDRLCTAMGLATVSLKHTQHILKNSNRAGLVERVS